jgi:hypothetical protein
MIEPQNNLLPMVLGSSPSEPGETAAFTFGEMLARSLGFETGQVVVPAIEPPGADAVGGNRSGRDAATPAAAGPIEDLEADPLPPARSAAGLVAADVVPRRGIGDPPRRHQAVADDDPGTGLLPGIASPGNTIDPPATDATGSEAAGGGQSAAGAVGAAAAGTDPPAPEPVAWGTVAEAVATVPGLDPVADGVASTMVPSTEPSPMAPAAPVVAAPGLDGNVSPGPVPATAAAVEEATPIGPIPKPARGPSQDIAARAAAAGVEPATPPSGETAVDGVASDPAKVVASLPQPPASSTPAVRLHPQQASSPHAPGVSRDAGDPAGGVLPDAGPTIGGTRRAAVHPEVSGPPQPATPGIAPAEPHPAPVTSFVASAAGQAPAGPVPHLSVLAARVLRAVDLQHSQPPPRSMVVDIPEAEGLRLVVSLHSGGQVHVAPAAGSGTGDALAPFMEEISRVLADRGFVMTGGDGRGGGRRDRDDFVPYRPIRQTPRRPGPTDNDLRI